LGEDKKSRDIVFDACRQFHAGHVEPMSAAEHDVFVALGLLVE
jgi:hypothetical protein